VVQFLSVRTLLSVIMPSYNGEKYIGSALQSVVAEPREGIEVIVVDDGSSDLSLDIVRGFMSRLPIRLITPSRTANWVTMSNLGLQHAKGDWACFLHQDDLWLPGRIGRLGAEMGKAQGVLVLHDAKFVGPEGQVLGLWTCPLREGNVPTEDFIEHLLIQNFIAICSPMFKRQAAVESGGMDEKLWYTADWDLWLRLGSLGPVRYVPETLGAFRVHPESQTVTHPFQPSEWERQLSTVFFRHFARWTGTGKRRAKVEQAALVSLAINAALAAVSRGEPLQWKGPLVKLLALGPQGWHRYLRDSRLVQRAGSRLMLRRLVVRAGRR